MDNYSCNREIATGTEKSISEQMYHWPVFGDFYESYAEDGGNRR